MSHLTGKTTLLKVLLGELDPVKGIRHAHRNLKIGYFAQHHIDALTMNCSPLELMASKFTGRIKMSLYFCYELNLNEIFCCG